MARLRDGTSIGEARAELATMAGALAVECPKLNAGYGVRVESLDEATVGPVRLALLLLLGVVGCVLLIACANVTNLMLARTSSRRHETAVRIALGASTGRLLRQRFAETALIATAGGALGIALGYWGTRFLVAQAPGDVPRLDEIAFSGPVVIFTAAVSVLVAFGTSVVPALDDRKLDLIDVLKSSVRATTSGFRDGAGRSRELRAGERGALRGVSGRGVDSRAARHHRRSAGGAAR